MGRTAYDFKRYAAAGPRTLRRYVQTFELPMPTDCDPSEMLLRLPQADELFKSHENRKLVAGHEAWRKLEWINPIILQKEFVNMFTRAIFPTSFQWDINHEDPIYSLPIVLPDKFYARKQCDIELMKPWLVLPLVTATRVMHLVEGNSLPHVFQVDQNFTKDRKNFQFLIWTRRWNVSGGAEDDKTRLIVAYQTPFVLSEQDLIEFIECTSLPPKDRPADNMPARYRLWAKIWDACYNSQCRWFVLTSYTHWVFGVFSSSMRTAFVTSIYEASHASPTILELLVYWMASAMGNSSGYIPEETMEPITMDDSPPDFETIRQRLSHTMWMPPAVPKSVMSEYAYPGKTDKNFDEPNVDLQSVLEGEGSLDTHYSVQEKLNPTLQKWIASNKNAKYRKLDEDDFVAVNLDNVALNNDDSFDPTKGRGDWMI